MKTINIYNINIISNWTLYERNVCVACTIYTCNGSEAYIHNMCIMTNNVNGSVITGTWIVVVPDFPNVQMMGFYYIIFHLRKSNYYPLTVTNGSLI
jgi:hypothetical protein